MHVGPTRLSLLRFVNCAWQTQRRSCKPAWILYMLWDFRTELGWTSNLSALQGKDAVHALAYESKSQNRAWLDCLSALQGKDAVHALEISEQNLVRLQIRITPTSTWWRYPCP